MYRSQARPYREAPIHLYYLQISSGGCQSSSISKKRLKWHFIQTKVRTNFLIVTHKEPFTLRAYVHFQTNINNSAQPDSCHFCFNDGKLLASFSGSQQTRDSVKREESRKYCLELVIRAILTQKCMWLGGNIPAIYKSPPGKILRPRSNNKLNHALGRFWGRDFKFQFGSVTWTKRATADGNKNF